MKLSHFFSHWEQIHKDTLDLIGKFSEDELDYIPIKGGWTVGEIALHIANAEAGWFGTIARKTSNQWPSNHTRENYPTIEAIKTLLAETHANSMAYLDKLVLDDLNNVVHSRWGDFPLRFIIWHVIEHEIHHRGELSLILGSLGREGLDV